MRTSNVSVTYEAGDALSINHNMPRVVTYDEGTPQAWTITHEEKIQVTVGQVTMFFSPGDFNVWLVELRTKAHALGFTGAIGDDL